MIPHSALLLFAGNEILLSNPGKKKNQRKCQRVVINRWIEMELSELHLACYRRVSKEIESVLRQKVEDVHNQHSKLLEKQASIAAVLEILLKSSDDDDI